MDNVSFRAQDELLMRLVHYFVTVEGYQPIYVHGVKDEIWLENIEGPYRIIRINNNYILNEEQFKYDQYKIVDILKQIKKKTVSFTVNALNINLNIEHDVNDDGLKNIDNIKAKDINEIIKNKDMLEIFPDIGKSLLTDEKGLQLIFNITRDINEKTRQDNIKYDKIFANKKIIVTYIIMALCVIGYIMLYVFGNGPEEWTLVKFGANHASLLKQGQVYRLITYAFLHGGILHILCNMYSLYIIGPHIENRFGKVRFIVIYLVSAICGGLLSATFNDYISIGASGAIFGLLGAFLYFGINFRLYLKDNLVSRILPVIIINLALGFMIPGIDNACHIGGLITGYLSAMAVGIPNFEKKRDNINGIILLTIFIAFLVYFVFFR